MPVTRDANYPIAPAKLFQAFNHCADGHEMGDVIDAAGNMLIAALTNRGRMAGHDADTVLHDARDICSAVIAGVEKNWKRERKPTDIPVSLD